ncbi:MAG: hypothetical protein GY944_03970 [bacterium]|nr:hypothetical protein [bacterium]
MAQRTDVAPNGASEMILGEREQFPLLDTGFLCERYEGALLERQRALK